MKFNLHEQLHDQEIISRNIYLTHLIKHQKKYLLLLLIIVLSIPLFSNYLADKPLIMGGESYYHLSQAKEINANNYFYFPLKIVVSLIPENYFFVLPVILAALSLLIFLRLANNLRFDRKFTLFFLGLLIISPAFILTFITISAYSIYFFLIILGFLLLTEKNKTLKYFSVIPFTLTAFIDVFSVIFLLLILMVYFYLASEKKQHRTIKLNMGAILLLTLINFFTHKIPLILGPFHLQQVIPDLVSDLGGLSGISFFTLLLALMGLTITWKKKNFYFSYLFLPLVIIPYIFNTQIIFHLSLVIIFFATTGIIKMFERNWNLVTIKKFTFFLLILGLLFSTLTYLDRVSDNGPSANDTETLLWMKDNFQDEKIIFSMPENSYFLSYFSHQKPFYSHHERNSGKEESYQQVYSSLYIHELFPLMEANNISIIYITEGMNKKLSNEQGLLFLLKNERFKLVHSHEGSEVWVFS
jgi:hypothetical protein